MTWREGFYTLEQTAGELAEILNRERRGIVVVRIAAPSEAKTITDVINAAFRQAESFFIERDRIAVEQVQSLLQTGEFLISGEDGTITGCVYVEMKGDRSYLGLLAVDPRAQKSGLGSKLMTAAEDHCRKAGSQFMDIQIVNLRKELPDFYRRRGYVETGIAPFTAGIDTKLPCHFVKMSKALAQS
ncbi:MAG: GNAT family N-acetyltransferase [Candidatus Sulfotelmatobacter sp.]|jgi:N-acetylglutamate synthase-like GNAT family acetyltransferase